MFKTIRTVFYNLISSEEYSELTKPEKRSILNRCILDSIKEFEGIFSEELTEIQKKKLSMICACFISHNLFLLYTNIISNADNISCHVVNKKEDKISNWESMHMLISLVYHNSPSDSVNDSFLLYFLDVVESFKNDLLQG